MLPVCDSLIELLLVELLASVCVEAGTGVSEQSFFKWKISRWKIATTPHLLLTLGTASSTKAEKQPCS